ncbi:divalent-cation tolerance protein CutA [Nitrososphaera sp.]|uniref:divalent-cation tolerance protein CutA n=1 Tax=Nitrososphaera sp. TaxID=1971748 RepID=UPI002ED95688
MGKQKGVIIISTFANEEAARGVSKKLVEMGLAACANLTPVRSIYTWRGRVEDQGECMAFFKTTQSSAKALKKEIAKLHPYDVPEVVEVKMADASKPYMEWLVGSTDRKAKKRHDAPKRRHP